jgi:hypothetical protein
MAEAMTGGKTSQEGIDAMRKILVDAGMAPEGEGEQ